MVVGKVVENLRIHDSRKKALPLSEVSVCPTVGSSVYQSQPEIERLKDRHGPTDINTQANNNNNKNKTTTNEQKRRQRHKTDRTPRDSSTGAQKYRNNKNKQQQQATRDEKYQSAIESYTSTFEKHRGNHKINQRF